jgi:flagellar hook-associated protein 1 FlgK
VQQGRALTDAIRRMDSQVRGVHQDVNRQIAGTADEINKLLEEVAKLNLQIVQMEGGSAIPSDAVGLRDRRNEALARLSEITDIRTIEQIEGDVVVYTGGEFLVSLGTAREVHVVTTIEDGLEVSEIRVVDTDGPITTGGGRLGGLMAARDEVVKGFLNDLDEFAQALIYEFNKVYSGGQGLSGYSELESEHAVSDPAVALDAAGLPFTPVNGLFQVQVYNTQTSQPRTTDIRVDLNGLAADTTLNDLAAQIDAIDGISASVTAAGKLQITADSAQISFAFAGDTSGVLAALGVNTFFSGTDASDIGVSDVVRGDPRKFAMSAGGIAEDTENGERLATLLTSPLASYGDASLAALYDALTGSVALGADTTRGAAEGLRHYQQALEGEHLAISGVNLDEEAVRMIAYQRAFQASAKVIATVNEMLETLLNL